VREPATPGLANAEGIYQDENDYAHFIKVEIGSEKQQLYLLVDTGAGTTWIMGSVCSSSACRLHDTFDPASSKSRTDTSRNFNIAYGSGQVSGHNVVDTLKLGNVEVSMEFGVAHDTSSDFEHFAFDGILGLSLNKGGTENLPQITKEQKKLEKNLFSVFLSRGRSGPNNGELTLGGINNAKYSGEITYTNVDAARNGDWAIPVEAIRMDGKDAKLEASRLGYIDTGTTYIFGPASDVKSVHDLVKGSKSPDGVSWTVPCDTTMELSFTFSGKTWTVLPQDWIEPPNAQGECQSNIYGHEVVPGAWLLGAQFLKNVYTVFDFQGDRAKIGMLIAHEQFCTLLTDSLGPGFAMHVHPDEAKAPGTQSSATAGSTAKPEGAPGMGVGGQETASAISSDAQPASTSSSSSSGETFPSHHVGTVLVTCAAVISILGIF
jgi:hypothetical protein